MVIANASEFLAAWNGDAAPSDVYAARLDESGVPVGALIQVTTGDRTKANVDVASDGTDFLAVWSSRSDKNVVIRGSRVSQEGVVLDPAALDLSTVLDSEGDVVSGSVEAFEPVAAFASDEYLVVWSDNRDVTMSGSTKLFAARVSTSGRVLDPDGYFVSVGSHAAIASNGKTFLVSYFGGDQNVHLRLLSPDGSVGPEEIVVTGSSSNRQDHAIASDGRDFLLSWVHDSGSATDEQIFLTPIDGTTAASKGSFAVSDDSRPQQFTALTYTGSEYFLTWNSWANATSTEVDAYGARVSAGGTLRDGTRASPGFLLLSEAIIPRVSAHNGHVVAIAQNNTGNGVVETSLSYGEGAPTPTPTPPSPSPTTSAMATPGPTPSTTASATPSSGNGHGGWSCNVSDGRESFVPATLLGLVVALSTVRRRSAKQGKKLRR